MSHPVTATTAIIAPSLRHDGWTPERQARFLDCLAGSGNVRAACARAGMSAEAAYRLRRRDALFARGWAAALVLAREASAEVLATRAIDGVEEEIYFRGELVGTRRRFDTRLLLSHMARLDRMAEEGGASEDAAAFDTLLAAIAGFGHPAEPGEDEEADTGPVLEREAYAEQEAERAGNEARLALLYAEEEESAEDDEDEDDDGDEDASGLHDTGEVGWAELKDAYEEAAECAHAEALVRWDAWFTDACGRLDAIIEGSAAARAPAPAPASQKQPCTVSTVSTLADAMIGIGASPLHRDYARA